MYLSLPSGTCQIVFYLTSLIDTYGEKNDGRSAVDESQNVS